MATLQAQFTRVLSSRPRVGIADLIAIVAAILSLLTLTLLLPAGIHLPW
jgi:hypothetical protein